MPVEMLVPADAEAMTCALEGLVAIDYLILTRARGRLPLLYQSGVVYRHQRNPKRWGHILEVIRSGYADCKNLSAWRAAELRYYAGVPARVHCYPTGPRRWHAVVQLPDGRTEDPSVRLGMRQEWR
jgi:hypothetical protein